jgi:hypothetical protein
MKDPVNLQRVTAALGLIAAAALSVLWTVLSPPFPSGYAERLAAIDDAGTSATVSAFAFAASQLPMLAAVLGIAHLVRRGAPVLANAGAVLAVIGVFGHSVFGGVSLTMVQMANDPGNRSVHAALLEDLESSPVMVFAASGLLGTVLGLLVLSIGLWRTAVVPRWIPALTWLFLIVEFVGTSMSEYATYVSGVCLVLAFGALARHIWQTPRPIGDAPAETVTAPDRAVLG